jgi:hypothetical protein
VVIEEILQDKIAIDYKASGQLRPEVLIRQVNSTGRNREP